MQQYHHPHTNRLTTYPIEFPILKNLFKSLLIYANISQKYYNNGFFKNFFTNSAGLEKQLFNK